MGHSHGHDHSHSHGAHSHGAHSHGSHAHGSRRPDRAFAIGVGLNVLYVAVEAGFGLWANSLALLADAGHNLSDVLGLLLAWGASYLASRPPRGRFTYGLRSTSILAASLNGLLLLVAVGGIVWEAVGRFQSPPEVPGWTIVIVAAIGVVINTATALLFMSGRKSDLNVRGAFLHMAADAAVSVGVVAAGAIIIGTGILWIDPTVSLIVAAVILWSTWGLLRESLELLLQAVPREVDQNAVRDYLSRLPGVTDLHDLHIWAMSTTEIALTVHLLKPEIENEDALLAGACHELHERFGIEHATIQIERGTDSHVCRQSGPNAV
ncbi:MAG: cation transporter [Planctomycetales bacterium]|nr:cation transporter [Planctomycetales bacterium]